MAQIKYSANLAAADFTLSFTYKGPSVIIPGPDQNYYQGLSNWSGATPQRGINIPQIAYCENTVPTAEGYRSVAYKFFIEPIPDQPIKVAGYFGIFDGLGKSAVLAVTSDRKLYILSSYSNFGWVKISGDIEADWTVPGQVTTAVVLGQALVMIATVGVFQIDLVNNTLIPKVLDGLDPLALNGICSASGYLIAWDGVTVYWSSTEDPFDFVPSLITGAGSAKVIGMKGTIRLIKDLATGFIIYTDVHIISAAYSSNLAIPWIFEILAGGSGIKWAQHVSEDINNQVHFVWSTGGILAVELHRITPQFPQVTDFVASGLIDTPSTDGLPVNTFDDKYRAVRLSIIAARYLCISVGTFDEVPMFHYEVHNLTQSLLYDLQFKRWGKLNVDHAQIIETPFSTEAALRDCREQVIAKTAELFLLEEANAATEAQIAATTELLTDGFTIGFLPAANLNPKYLPTRGKFVMLNSQANGTCVLEDSVVCGTRGTIYDAMDAVTDIVAAPVDVMLAGPNSFLVTGDEKIHGHGQELTPNNVGKTVNRAGFVFLQVYVICRTAATPLVEFNIDSVAMPVGSPGKTCPPVVDYATTPSVASGHSISTGPNGNILGGGIYKSMISGVCFATPVPTQEQSGEVTVTGEMTGTVKVTISGVVKTLSYTFRRS